LSLLEGTWHFLKSHRCHSSQECIMYRIHFYPRDAMLARVLANVAMALRLSVCLSVCRKLECSLETDERIELVFGMGAYFHPSYTVLKGNSGISKYKGTSPGTLSQTRDLENFASMYRSSKRVIDLARERWTLRE